MLCPEHWKYLDASQIFYSRTNNSITIGYTYYIYFYQFHVLILPLRIYIDYYKLIILLYIPRFDHEDPDFIRLLENVQFIIEQNSPFRPDNFFPILEVFRTNNQVVHIF